MIPSHRRTLESSSIAPLLLVAALVGVAIDAHAMTALPDQETAPQEPPAWLGDLTRLVSDERLAELELLGRTEGTAAVLAQLATDREAIGKAAETWVNARGWTRNSSQYKMIQRELDATLSLLATLEAATKSAMTRHAAAGEQTSRAAATDRAEIRSIVAGALVSGNANLLNQFGGAIEDQLAEHALEATHPAALLRTKTRVLAALAEIAPERAVDVALELLGRPGRGWAAAVGQSLTTHQSGLPDPYTVHVPVGSPGSKSFELALHLVASDQVPEDTRVALALAFLAAGIDDPRLLAASEALAPEMRKRRSFTSSKLEWWHDLLLASESQEVRRAAVQARLKYDAGDLALLERLLQDEDSYNRVAVASSLPEALPAKAPISPEYRALWTRALADPAAEVRRTASEALVYRAQVGSFPLSAQATMDLVIALDDPTDAAARAELLAEVSSVISALPAVATSNEELGQVYAALLESRLAEVTSGVLEALKHAHPEVFLAMLTSLGTSSPEVSERLASTLRGYSKLSPASDEACLRAFAHLLQRPQQPAALVEALRATLRDRSREHSLDTLPPADAVEVLLRSAEAAPELVVGFLLSSRWERCAQVLTAAAGDAARTQTGRSLALMALERSRSSTQQSIAVLTESIAAAFRAESERGSAPRLVTWATKALEGAPQAHGALIIALMGRPEVPTATFNDVSWTNTHAEALSAEEKRVLFDALAERADGVRSGPEPFSGFAKSALTVMQREPSLERRNLVLAWSEHNIALATTVALNSKDPDLAAALRERFLAKLEGAIHDFHMTSLIAALIHLEGPLSAADDVADLAARLGKPQLVTIATELLETSAKLREVGARLASTSTGTSREAAVTEVLTLLDAPDEAVRVEAIRGLATLGAIEHLPRLIRIVGTGTPAERTAARAALDTLHQRAAREPQQSPPKQPPPTQPNEPSPEGAPPP